ncbi:MAG: small subunit of carbamoyl-phosphate synthase [Olpidium bornovanus]|uniref:Carbamoyl phosphate synthase arginine-specific small chain n=1 Tax=Olpidium bornovanus TaxID=278681 RepID=A0A8H8DL92_9FUNG|nr:MAG: small subunit of carbamoyl-phosphate synthase [Olpidium bornovanus]
MPTSSAFARLRPRAAAALRSGRACPTPPAPPPAAGRLFATAADGRAPPAPARRCPEPAGARTEPVKATLKILGGPSFEGRSFGADTSVAGEAVFTTSLVGYPESMTDPSYAGQILVFTQPLIGNYGVPPAAVDRFGLLTHFESAKIHPSAIVVCDYAARYSHWNAVSSLGDWCKAHNVPAVTGVDTREIVHVLRENGSSPASLVVGADGAFEPDYVDPNTLHLVDRVSVKSPVVYNRGGDVRVALVDCGVKQNIIRCLCAGGAEVVLLPWDYDFIKDGDRFDGLFVSNGPGDPRHCVATVGHLRVAVETWDKPIFGICMGNQLLGMAAGLKVKKMRFGNRGHNQPAVNLRTGQCVITSQNHSLLETFRTPLPPPPRRPSHSVSQGFALDDTEMPAMWERYFVNANDGSNEGIRHATKPFCSVQFHPEYCGGPRDCEPLFDEFLAAVRRRKAEKARSAFASPSSREVPPGPAPPPEARAATAFEAFAIPA